MAQASATTADLSAGRVTKRKVEEAILALDSSLKHAPSLLIKKRKQATNSSQGISTPLLLSLLPPSSHRTPSAPPTPPPTSYTPLSLPSLLQRISTYRLTTFSLPKPHSLLPSSLALSGWINVSPGRERVQCVTCGKGVVLAPPSAAAGGWTSPAGRKLVEEYERLVGGNEGGGEAHQSTCPWRMRRASRALYRVQVGGRRKVLAEVGEAARKLEGLKGIRVALGEGVVDGKELERLVKAVREAEGAEGKEELTEETILLALFGWEAPSSPSRPTTSTATPPPIISCPLCTRQSLTSSYLPPSPTSSEPQQSASTKTFNPLTSHALFCPFIDSYAGVIPPSTTSSSSSLSSLAGTPSRAGWKLRVEAIVGVQGRRGSGEGGGGEGEGEGREKRGTRELLSYVRGLLGPKGR